MLEKITSILEDASMSFPRVLLKLYKKLNLTDFELIFFIYLLNEKSLIFNAEKIGKDLSLNLEQVLEIITNLENKDLLELEVIKERNIRSEYFKLDKLYKKMAFLLVNETSEKNEVKSTLYDAFEKEFGRTLSPNEYAIIGKLEESYTEELVLCALTEAVYNDVRNLRYIDHILAEWKRKGIKTKSDVENSKKEYKKIKKEKETKKLFEYDYLNEDE